MTKLQDRRGRAKALPQMTSASHRRAFAHERAKLLGKAALFMSAAALCGAAHAAASEVQISGNLDAGLRNTRAPNSTVSTMSNNGLFKSNRLDFTGSEYLGNGYSVHFLLESGFNLGNGGLDNTQGNLFNRGSWVGITGPDGAVNFGRQYTVAHDVLFHFDPFHFEYPSILPILGATGGARFNQDVKYLGHFGHLHIRAENSFGGVANSLSSGSARGLGGWYSTRSWAAGAVYEHRSVAAGSVYNPDNYYGLMGSTKVGKLNLSGGYFNELEQYAQAVDNVRTQHYFFGGSYRIVPRLVLAAAYYLVRLPNTDGQRKQGIVSAAYSLSKTTTLFAETDYTQFTGSYITNKSLNPINAPHELGISVGMNVLF
jgi:predicted porin